MTAPSPSRAFLPALTGVRSLAAFWVLALHMQVVVTALLPRPVAEATGFMARPGFLGVDLFFVLSGFIISYNYAALFDSGTTLARYGRFLWARLARIYPVHIALLLALFVAVRGLGLGAQIDADRFTWTGLIESVLLVQSWVGDTDVWNAVSWSISSEWLAYLCFPALSSLARRASAPDRPLRSWAWMCLVAVLPALRDTLARHVAGVPDLPPLQIACEFFAGCLTYRLFAGHAAPPAWARHAGLAMVGFVATAAALVHAGESGRFAVLFVPPLLLGLTHTQGWLARTLARPGFVYWGKVSFALYMTHYLWLWVMHSFLPLATLATYGVHLRIAFVLAHLVPTLGIAVVTYHLIEEPARRAMTRWVRRPT